MLDIFGLRFVNSFLKKVKCVLSIGEKVFMGWRYFSVVIAEKVCFVGYRKIIIKLVIFLGFIFVRDIKLVVRIRWIFFL